MRLRTIPILGLLIALSNISSGQNSCLERIKNEAENISRTQYASGTGFLIDNSGFIITNKHVIHEADSISVTFFIGDKKVTRTAKFIIQSIVDDIALIKAPVEGLFNDILPYGFNKQEMNQGEKIYILGYPSPDRLGENIKLTDGIISATSGFRDDKSLYQISAPIQPGNSGSPIFDNNGNVRGIVVSSYVFGQNVNYAIKSEILYDLIDATNYGTSIKLNQLTLKKSFQEFNNLIPRIRNRICLIYTKGKRTSFNEFSLDENYENKRESALSFQSCNNQQLKAFTDPKRFDPAYNFEKENKSFINWVNTSFTTPMERALFYSYLSNFKWDLFVLSNKFKALLEVEAYDNVIEEHNFKFTMVDNSVDLKSFVFYVNNIMDSYLIAQMNKSAGYDRRGYWESYMHIQRLLEINEGLAYQSQRKKSVHAYLLVKKAAFMILLEQFFEANEICETISLAQSLDTNVDITFLEMPCN
jgi:hypothetical protein